MFYEKKCDFLKCVNNFKQKGKLEPKIYEVGWENAKSTDIRGESGWIVPPQDFLFFNNSTNLIKLISTTYI